MALHLNAFKYNVDPIRAHVKEFLNGFENNLNGFSADEICKKAQREWTPVGQPRWSAALQLPMA
jgi:hypothetical protein